MRRHFRLPRFALWVKVLTLWLCICLLGTEWNWQILATTCDGEMQLPIDDTKGRMTGFFPSKSALSLRFSHWHLPKPAKAGAPVSC